MALTNPRSHTNFAVFPKLDTPVVDEQRLVTNAWYRFLLGLWKRTGGSLSPQSDAVYLTKDVETGQVMAFDANTGQALGEVITAGQSSDSLAWQAVEMASLWS